MAKPTQPAPNYGSTTPFNDADFPPSPKPTHMTTYTAGEDAGRLASLAKEFGLAKQRAPREGVRVRVNEDLGELNLHRLKLWYNQIASIDEEYLDEIKFSVFSAHQNGEDLSESDWGDDEAEEEARDEFLVDKEKALQIEEPLDAHGEQVGGTLASATLGIIKGMIGPAILYLPHAFAAAGYAVAIPLLILSTTMFLWSSQCLLESWRIEHDRLSRRSMSRRKRRVHLSYPELAYRAFGTKGEKVVQIGISMMQSGVCITYLIFVPQNLHTSALILFNWDISANWCLLFMMAVQIPLSWIRDIRKFKMTNLLGNLLIFYGWIACLGFALDAMVNFDDGPNAVAGADESLSDRISQRFGEMKPFNPSGWFLFIGTSVFMFEGSITLLVPQQEAVQLPSDKRKFPSLYKKVITSIVCFYCFYSISCWMAFGDDVKTVMTTSLPAGKLATTIQLAYSFAVVFTFPLQNYPSLEIVRRLLDRFFHSDKGSYSQQQDSPMMNVVTTMVVVLLSIIAVTTMDVLDKVVGIMGSVLGIPLAFICPPLIHNKLAGDSIGKLTRIGNLTCVGLGILAVAISSVATVLEMA